MCNKEYNGYTNYETWLVGLWLDNDQGNSELLREISQGPGNLYGKSKELQEWVEDMNPITDASLWMDLLNGALSEVNWRELIETRMEE